MGERERKREKRKREEEREFTDDQQEILAGMQFHLKITVVIEHQKRFSCIALFVFK